MRRATLMFALATVSCSRPGPTSETPRATSSSSARAAAPAIVLAPSAKAPWREPALLTTPRHPLADARVVGVAAGKAVVRTVNAVVTVAGAGNVERAEPIAVEQEETPIPAGFEAISRERGLCSEQAPWLQSWARLVEPTSLAALRAALPPVTGAACTHVATGGRVRSAAPADATEPCALAECLRGTTDAEPELTRTHLALVPGRCAPADADATGACRAGAAPTQQPGAVLADLEGRKVTFLLPPPACHPTRALAAGGLPLLLCDGGPVPIWAALPDGTWRAEGTLPVRDEEIGGVALASDGTLLLRAAWKDPARKRAFVRAPRPAGEAAAWREIQLGDALDVRVAPGGAALLVRALDDGRALSIELDGERGRMTLAPRVPLSAHVVDVSIERGKIALWTLPSMHRGRPARGSAAARGAAEAFAVLADGSLEKLPPSP